MLSSTMAENDDEELARDIGYALWRSPFKAKGQGIDACRTVAGAVVKHLHRANWRFTRKPPSARHGTLGVARGEGSGGEG